ncbi:MAG: thioredoxin family protein [Marinilabiliaceae bacterium]|nr:thioredoxin family protein [Marinilabiliaceae bacterium]
MRYLFTLFSLIACLSCSTAQQPYNPQADAKKEIQTAVNKVAQDNKQVLLIIGGNWCPWCVKLNKYIKEETEVAELLAKEFEVVKVNYSKDNKNAEVLTELEFPQRFGFPVLVVLDKNGKRIHTQNSAYLELDKGYSEEKVMGFLKKWTAGSIDPANYK